MTDQHLRRVAEDAMQRLRRFINGETARTIYKVPPSGTPFRRDVSALLDRIEALERQRDEAREQQGGVGARPMLDEIPDAIRAVIAAAESRALSAEAERDELRFAICGGEDAPGYNASLPHATILQVLRDNYARAASPSLAEVADHKEGWRLRALSAEARAERAERRLDGLYDRAWELMAALQEPAQKMERIAQAKERVRKALLDEHALRAAAFIKGGEEGAENLRLKIRWTKDLREEVSLTQEGKMGLSRDHHRL